MMNRREFIALAASGAAAVGLGAAGGGKGRILFGACRGFDDAGLMKELGYDFVEGGVGRALQPDKTDEKWRPMRDRILALPIPLRSCAGFLPGSFRLTGPKAEHSRPLEYAATACRRADEVGMKVIVLGSGGARNAPKGFPKEKAVDQFVEFCRLLGRRIEGCKVKVVLEPLRPKEANFLNFVREGREICERVGSPSIRLLADIYHMMEGGEEASSIEQTTSDLLLHCHIAEKGRRTAPGMMSDGSQFAPYFAALKKIGYSGGVSCECGWGDRKDLRRNLERALSVMKKVAGQA